jgi:hypothetical protein
MTNKRQTGPLVSKGARVGQVVKILAYMMLFRGVAYQVLES